MKVTQEYPIDIYFIDKEDLRKSLGRPVDNRYIVAASMKSKVFYDPTIDKIVAEFEGENLDETVKTELEFMEIAKRRKKRQLEIELRKARTELRRLKPS